MQKVVEIKISEEVSSFSLTIAAAFLNNNINAG